MRIDAHQHFWTIERTDYGWLTPELGSIYRDWLPHDLEPLLDKANIEGSVLVQAAPTRAETEYLLGLADNNAFIKGVVGWVDFEATGAPSDIQDLAKHPALMGLRPMIQDIADTDWMLNKTLTPAFNALIAHNLTFDALTLPRHLTNLAKLLARHPTMRTVIDHASKPLIQSGIIEGWNDDIATLARDTNAYCKLSGLVTEDTQGWTIEKLRPYVDHLLETFGPSRLIWGSDWPVCTLASTYELWLETTDILVGDLTQSERDAIMGGNAVRAYTLRD